MPSTREDCFVFLQQQQVKLNLTLQISYHVLFGFSEVRNIRSRRALDYSYLFSNP